MPLGVISADAEGRIQAVNPALLKILGSPSAGETASLNLLTFPLLVEAGASARIGDCLATGNPADIEFPYKSKWGRDVVVNARAVPFRGATGAVEGIDIVIEDVKKRREAEEALREARHFTDHVLQTTPGVLYIFDLDEKRTVFSNREMAAVLGYAPEEAAEIKLRPFETVVHPEDLPKIAVHQARLASAAEGEVVEIEYRLRDRQGNWRRFVSRDTVFSRDASGRANRILGLAADVTAERLTQDALRESEERFRHTFEEAAVGIAHTAPDGTITLANRRFCEITGYSRDEVLGRSIQSVANASHGETEAALVEGLLKGEIPSLSREHSCVRKDGARTWVHCNMSVVRGPSGEPKYMVVVIEDVNRQKWLEERLREMSLRDELTGLYNRRGFMTLGEQHCRAAERRRSPMALIYADVDGLKMLNDSHGHDLGDAAIKEAADVLRETFRSEDIMARIGGDEFVVLVTDAAMLTPEIFLTHLRRQIEAHNTRPGRKFGLSLSAGAVAYDPAEHYSVYELLSKADRLMYEAKHGPGPAK